MRDEGDRPTRVLAITDLSTDGDAALVEAARVEPAAKLCVVHTVPQLEAIRPLFPQRLAEDSVIAADLPHRAEATLRSHVAASGLDPTTSELVIERGSTVEGALHAIERWRPDLVVIGANDGGMDACRLVRHISCPMLVARPGLASGIVVAGTDLSDPSMPAIRAAAATSTRRSAELVVAHAIEVNPLTLYGVALPPMLSLVDPREIHDAARQRLEQAVHACGVTARLLVNIGPPGTMLVELARAEQAQLVVVATHGRTGLTRFVLGSVAENVIRHAPCSVLVVRAS